MIRVPFRVRSFGFCVIGLIASFLACAHPAEDTLGEPIDKCSCTVGEKAQCVCSGNTHGTKTCALGCKTWTACSCADAGSSGGSGGKGGAGGSAGKGGSGGTAGKGGSSGKGGSAGTGANDGGPGCVAAGLEDQCPGKPVTLTGTGSEPRVGSVKGATNAMCADYKASCQTATAKDVVYQVTPDCDGELSAEASSPGFFEPILYARSECSNAATELGCTDMQSQAIKFPVLASQTYYLMVTGAMFPGQYVIDTTINCSVCGNGVLEASEECDDGNSADGDGCSKACKFESAGPGDTCPGTTLTFVDSAGTLVATATGDTNPLYAQYAGTCGQTDASGDAVYQLNTGAGGTLTATLETPGTAFDSVLYLRSGTCAQGTEVECADVAGNGGESITLTVQPNQDLWVFIDGHDSERGPYALKVTLVP